MIGSCLRGLPTPTRTTFLISAMVLDVLVWVIDEEELGNGYELLKGFKS